MLADTWQRSSRSSFKVGQGCQAIASLYAKETWNKSTGKYNQYKCSRLFYSLCQAYKKIQETNVKSFLSVNEQEYRLFQKRKAVLKSRFLLEPQNGLQDLHSHSSQSFDGDAEDSFGGQSVSFEEDQLEDQASLEDLDAILVRPLKCVDVGFSNLSSWVKREAIPVGQDLVNDLTSRALQSSKRGKSPNDLLHEWQLDLLTGSFRRVRLE